MSTIWTPSGEQPVGREDPAAPTAPREAEREPQSREEIEAELQALQEELARTPASVVIVNHAMGLFELAALHLSQEPPNLAEATLAIDAMGAVVDNLAGRLGEHESTVKEALAQLRMAFVQLQAAEAGEDE